MKEDRKLVMLSVKLPGGPRVTEFISVPRNGGRESKGVLNMTTINRMLEKANGGPVPRGVTYAIGC